MDNSLCNIHKWLANLLFISTLVINNYIYSQINKTINSLKIIVFFNISKIGTFK